MNRNKTIFFTVWIFLLAIGPITVLRNTPLTLLTHANLYSWLNIAQRFLGLAAFSLLFIQIILGAFMSKLTEKLGGWVFSFHIFEGALIYTIVVLHPLMFVLLNYKAKGVFDPFYVYTDICVICANIGELFYTFGRVAFWLITVAVVAAKLRTQPALTRYWRYFHILNYFAFGLIAVHSYFVGTDTHSKPFVYFYWLAIFGVIVAAFYRRILHYKD